MKKRIIAAAAALAVSAAVCVGVMADDTIKVLVNGEQVKFAEQNPFIEEERTLVPMREIFEALGAKVAWDGETKTIVSYDPISDVSITMQIDSKKMFVNEKEIELDVPAKIVGTSTVVPVRAVSEGMNSTVGWDGASQVVTVTKDIAKLELTN